MYKFLCFLILLGSPVFASSLKITIAGTAQGQIEIDLFEDIAPLHVAQISKLAEQGHYNNVIFHRVIEGFMAQTGDVEYGKAGGDVAFAGRGGSTLPDLPGEFSDIKRKAHYANTASKQQVSKDIYKSSLKKEEFMDLKDKFYDDLAQQDVFWEKQRNI